VKTSTRLIHGKKEKQDERAVEGAPGEEEKVARRFWKLEFERKKKTVKGKHQKRNGDLRTRKRRAGLFGSHCTDLRMEGASKKRRKKPHEGMGRSQKKGVLPRYCACRRK